MLHIRHQCFSVCLIINEPFHGCMFLSPVSFVWSTVWCCWLVRVSESCLSPCLFSVSVCWVHVRGWSSEDGSGRSTATGIKNCGRDYFKCQHNVMSCVRRSNVQTVLSGEQLIDQVQFGLLWLLWWIDWPDKTSCFCVFFKDIEAGLDVLYSLEFVLLLQLLLIMLCVFYRLLSLRN